MRKAKTPLLALLQRAMSKAIYLQENPNSPPIDELVEMAAEKKETEAYSRRQFLKESLVAGAVLGTSMLIPESLYANALGKTKPKVAVIGGGLSGLYATYLLKKKGIIATIYEADGRTGGRMFTVQNVMGAGLYTEFGGEFVDTDHTEMHNLAKLLKLEFFDVQTDKGVKHKEAFFYNGRHYTEEDVIKEFTQIAGKIKTDLAAAGENTDTPTAEQLDNISITEYLRKLPCAEWIKTMLDTAYTAEFGLESNEQSALNLITMVSPETKDGFKIFGDSDERFKTKGGNQQFVDRLSVLVQDQIKTGAKLIEIRENGKRYDLIFEGNKVETTDFVIVTVPFTVLRNIKLPKNISETKMKCIKELGYGTNSKLMMGFSKRTWRNLDYSGGLFNDVIQNGWDNSWMQNDNQGKGGYTVFLGGKRGLDLNIGQYTDYLSTLDKIFKGAKQDALADKIRVQNWSKIPYFGGSYACYKVGQWSTISGQEIEPAGNIYFAGDHCSSDYQGYMNGAAETGRKTAELIIKRVKKWKG